MNNVVTENSNAIVIVNDNDQSIAKNPTGGIYTALRKLRKATARPKTTSSPPWGMSTTT